MTRRLVSLLALLLFVAPSALADNWPAWRGPTGDGQCTEKNLPTKWSTTENVRWKTALPGPGNSTPIIWGDRIFLTQAKENGKKRLVMCFKRSDGSELWKKETEYKDKETTHKTNPYCSASPVTDGERVVASLGSAGMVCYDMAGKELWRKDVGKLEQIWGNASSPILYGDLAILWCGPGERQFLLAVDKKTGKDVWKHDEPGGAFGKAQKDWLGSWSTPIIIKVKDQDQLVLSVPEKLKGFDPKTGKELWSCSGLGKLVYTSPVHANGIVVSMSGYHQPALAVQLGGEGDITKDRLWHHKDKVPQRIGAPVIVGDHAYILNENGTPQCFELKTGKEAWEPDKKDKGRASETNWGSMVAADGKLYVTDQKGTTVIFAASPEYKVIGKNSLGEHTNASIAVSNGDLFIRTDNHLWCIGGK